jgi:hypothetical protein
LSLKEIHIIYFATLVLLGTGCSEFMEDESTVIIPKSKTEYCLEQLLPKYSNLFEEMNSELMDYGLVDDSKDSYATLYLNIDSVEYEFHPADIQKLKLYDFLSMMGPHFQIHMCSTLAVNDSCLTSNQKDYYWQYDWMGKNGGLYTDSLAMIIQKMTDEEFESDGIKESTVYYLGQQFITNRYFRIWEENAP